MARERTVGKLHKMATALMKMIDPNAGEVYEGGDTQAPKAEIGRAHV